MPAPKGNDFAIGNSGTEKMFKTVEELEDAINEYFEQCDKNTTQVVTKMGDVVDVISPIPYTVEGLCEVLDCDRATLLNYEKAKGYEVYFNTIKKAKRKVLRNKAERALTGRTPATYAIFDLVNNSDYQNTSSIDLTSKGEKLNQPQHLTKDELIEKMKDLDLKV